MADPVSWFVIEPGWKVVDADGEQVGTVDEVVGDSGDDIFNSRGTCPRSRSQQSSKGPSSSR
jgi:hypothetical protein